MASSRFDVHPYDYDLIGVAGRPLPLAPRYGSYLPPRSPYYAGDWAPLPTFQPTFAAGYPSSYLLPPRYAPSSSYLPLTASPLPAISSIASPVVSSGAPAPAVATYTAPSLLPPVSSFPYSSYPYSSYLPASSYSLPRATAPVSTSILPSYLPLAASSYLPAAVSVTRRPVIQSADILPPSSALSYPWLPNYTAPISVTRRAVIQSADILPSRPALNYPWLPNYTVPFSSYVSPAAPTTTTAAPAIPAYKSLLPYSPAGPIYGTTPLLTSPWSSYGSYGSYGYGYGGYGYGYGGLGYPWSLTGLESLSGWGKPILSLPSAAPVTVTKEEKPASTEAAAPATDQEAFDLDAK